MFCLLLILLLIVLVVVLPFFYFVLGAVLTNPAVVAVVLLAWVLSSYSKQAQQPPVAPTPPAPSRNLSRTAVGEHAGKGPFELVTSCEAPEHPAGVRLKFIQVVGSAVSHGSCIWSLL